MADEIGELDLTAQANAAKTATSYMHFDSTNGLKIAQSSPSSATKLVQITPSNGVLIQNDASNYARVNSNGLEVYQGGTSIANFGSTARIGKAYVASSSNNEVHLEIDYHSLQFIDKFGDTFFHVSDLRDKDGYITDTFTSDGTTKTFTVSQNITSSTNITITVNGTANSGWSWANDGNSTTFTLSSAPADNATVKIKYPWNYSVYAYTMGKRKQSAIGYLSIAEGYNTIASGYTSHAEGNNTIASGYTSHAEGNNTIASGSQSHAEGNNTIASGYTSHAEGSNTIAKNLASHAEGENTVANGDYTHAEGHNTIARGYTSHVEGFNTIANGNFSHAEGHNTRANGYGSHAEGFNTIANNNYSHAQNEYTSAIKRSQTVLGTYNKKDTSTTTTHPSGTIEYGTYAVIVGNGTGDSDSNRSNAAALKWDGTLELAKALPVVSGGTGITNFGHIDDYNETISTVSGTAKNLKKITLTAGIWLITANVWFASNATGRRAAKIATSNTDAGAGAGGMQVTAVNGSNTTLQLIRVVNPTASTDYYLNAFQNCGSNLNAAYYLSVMRLG